MTREEMIEKAGIDDDDSFVQVVYSDKIATACCFSDNKKNNLNYTIVINSQYSESQKKTLLAHECGHIIKGHTKANSDMLLRGLMTQLDPNSKLGDKKNVLSHYFENVFQDYEINSEIFTPEMRADMTAAGIGGLHPSDVGFPEGKLWFEYAMMAFQDIENFLKKLHQQQNGNAGNNEQQNGSGGPQQDGNGGSQQSESADGSEQQSRGQNSSEGTGNSEDNMSLDDLIQQAVQDAEKAEKAEKVAEAKAKAAAKEAADRKAGEGTDTDENTAETSLDRKTIYLNGVKKLSKWLKKRECHTDLFYYSRKGKTSGGVIIPKRRNDMKNFKRDFVILCDVSGSQDAMEIKSVCDAIAEVACANIHLVTWNECLSQSFDFKKAKDLKDADIKIGGGTNLGPGVRWCKKHFKKIDNFFLFSDFEDMDNAKLYAEIKSLRKDKHCTTNALFSCKSSKVNEIMKGKVFNNVLDYDGKLMKVA